MHHASCSYDADACVQLGTSSPQLQSLITEACVIVSGAFADFREEGQDGSGEEPKNWPVTGKPICARSKRFVLCPTILCAFGLVAGLNRRPETQILTHNLNGVSVFFPSLLWNENTQGTLRHLLLRSFAVLEHPRFADHAVTRRYIYSTGSNTNPRYTVYLASDTQKTR